VINVAPSVTLDPPPVSEIAVGGTWTTTGTVSDPGGVGTLTASVDFGDGSAAEGVNIAADGTFVLSHTYTAHGTFTATGTVVDPSGAHDDDSSTVIVDAPPVLTDVPDQQIDEGLTFQVTVSASDPDTLPADLRYSFLTAPQGATIDPVRGLVTWTPG